MRALRSSLMSPSTARRSRTLSADWVSAAVTTSKPRPPSCSARARVSLRSWPTTNTAGRERVMGRGRRAAIRAAGRGARRSVRHRAQRFEQPLRARDLREVTGVGTHVHVGDPAILADQEQGAAAVTLVALQYSVGRHRLAMEIGEQRELQLEG